MATAPANAAEVAGAACPGLTPGPVRTVTRILDGETVGLDDGTELRLVGALAPRAIDVDAEPGTWRPETVAAEALRRLVLGRSVALAFAGQPKDRYGRLQAQAFLTGPDSRRRWIQADLVAQGLARVYTQAGDPTCSTELLAAERAARTARRGLWVEAAYRIRRADNPAELMRYRATFQVVEGEIVSVARLRYTIYLNFARNWRRGFSASLRRRDRGLLGAYASRPWGLEGRRVRVRGWIARQRSGAPIVDLSAGGLIEVLSEAERPPRPAASRLPR